MREPVKYGDYWLFERVAVGGMAEVFKGVSYGVEGFERLFAVKRVLPNISEDQEFIDMFIDEAKIAVQLTHANIGQIFELGCAEDAYFIAMEFVQGKDLRAIFDRARNDGAPLDIPMCCHVVKEVCEALEYAHGKKNERQEPLNLIHRDVSPQNIIVSYDGEVKLIDFGIAKAAGKASKTQAGILKGKFGYMSPEQVRGKPIDRRSDLFSLAVVLYELLTLERCFQGESDFSTLEKVRSVDIRRPSALNRDIPPELERIVLRGLSRNPEERYQHASELQDALQKFLYQSGTFYARKDLGAYMRRTFDKSLREEQRRMGEFRDWARNHVPEARRASSVPRPEAPAAPAEVPFKPDLPALSWEQEEIETSVWDRSPSQVLPAMEVTLDRTPDPAFVSAGRAPAPPSPSAPHPVLPPSSTPALVGPAQLPDPALDELRPSGALNAHRGDAVSGRLMALLVVAVLSVLGAGAAIYFWPRKPPTASVTIESHPADIAFYVDGQLVREGRTPITLDDLSPGTHKLQATADGYHAWQQEVTFAEGERKRLPILLHRAATTGLHVETVPSGARVYVDDRRLDDETPVVIHDVEPGERQLRIEKTGFLPWRGKVNVVGGREIRVEPIRLAPEQVSVTFLPDPDQATISLKMPDGKVIPLGAGSVSYDGLPNAGEVTVVAELTGHETVTRRLPRFYEPKITEFLTLRKTAEPPKVVEAPPAPRVRRPAAPETPRRDPQPRGCRGEDCPPDVVATPRPEPTPPPAPPPAPAENKTGYLKLLAKPPAKAFYNGRDLGWTPLLKQQLPAGSHTITLVREEDPPYRKELTVVIEADKITFHRFAP